MLSKIVSIAKREDLQEKTGLTERQMQLLFFLTLNPEQEFTFGDLQRQIEDELKIYFNDSTLSRSLAKLEEKQIIIWDRAEKLQKDIQSKIRLNNEDIGNKLDIQNQIQQILSEFEQIKQNAETMSEKEITCELIELAKNQAGASLYLRLLYAQGTFDEEQTNLLWILNNIFSEAKQDKYIEAIKMRGKKSIIEVLHHFLNSGIKIE